MNKRQKEERRLQTAQELAQEYSNQLEILSISYEMLSGQKLAVDDVQFWESSEVQKIETLVAFWWRMARMNDPEDFI